MGFNDLYYRGDFKMTGVLTVVSILLSGIIIGGLIERFVNSLKTCKWKYIEGEFSFRHHVECLGYQVEMYDNYQFCPFCGKKIDSNKE